MTREKVNMNYGVDDLSTSVSKASVIPAVITPANGVSVDKFFAAKDNSAYLLIIITTAGAMTLKAGNAYPSNNCLGDMIVDLPIGTHLITVERAGRFENKDGSLEIDFAVGTAGTIAAFGKKAGLR